MSGYNEVFIAQLKILVREGVIISIKLDRYFRGRPSGLVLLVFWICNRILLRMKSSETVEKVNWEGSILWSNSSDSFGWVHSGCLEAMWQ